MLLLSTSDPLSQKGSIVSENGDVEENVTMTMQGGIEKDRKEQDGSPFQKGQASC